MKGSVAIDCFPESAERYRQSHVIVVVDVIRSTTSATTAVNLGWLVYPVRTTDEAYAVAATLENPLLVGELGGNMPYGFDMTNSPAQIAARNDTHRPMVHISSSGTDLLMNARGGSAIYLGCFRNMTALAQHLAQRHRKIAVIGAGTRGQFRREDQMGCAWIAEKLLQSGFEIENTQTGDCITQWYGASPEIVRLGRSAEYLRRTGQAEDLDFVLNHIDDLTTVPVLKQNVLVDAAKIEGQEQ